MEWNHGISVKFIQMTFKWKEKQRGEIVKVSSPHTLNKEKGKTTLLYVVLFFWCREVMLSHDTTRALKCLQ